MVQSETELCPRRQTLNTGLITTSGACYRTLYSLLSLRPLSFSLLSLRPLSFSLLSLRPLSFSILSSSSLFLSPLSFSILPPPPLSTPPLSTPLPLRSPMTCLVILFSFFFFFLSLPLPSPPEGPKPVPDGGEDAGHHPRPAAGPLIRALERHPRAETPAPLALHRQHRVSEHTVIHCFRTPVVSLVSKLWVCVFGSCFRRLAVLSTVFQICVCVCVESIVHSLLPFSWC